MNIRERYELLGVGGSYRGWSQRGGYKNPHFPLVRKALEENHQDLPLEKVLDLGAGHGEVTKCLTDLGYSDITGADPFLNEMYEKETGRKCLPISFKDIATGTLKEEFSCIICSFSLHLCDRSMMHNLLYMLSRVTNTLVVISPTKFPVIGTPEVEKFIPDQNGKRIHFRVYNLPIT